MAINTNVCACKRESISTCLGCVLGLLGEVKKKKEKKGNDECMCVWFSSLAVHRCCLSLWGRGSEEVSEQRRCLRQGSLNLSARTNIT